jgi:hypothetical protein
MLDDDFILLRRLQLKLDLIPGPPHHDKQLYNPAIQAIARYPAAEVATAVGDMRGITLVTDGQRDPRAWQWVWRDGARRLRVGFSAMGSNPEDLSDLAWGGSPLEADCLVGDLITFWAHLRRTHPDTWLHYDGRVYTPQGFVDRIRDMIQNQVITDLV